MLLLFGLVVVTCSLSACELLVVGVAVLDSGSNVEEEEKEEAVGSVGSEVEEVDSSVALVSEVVESSVGEVVLVSEVTISLELVIVVSEVPVRRKSWKDRFVVDCGSTSHKSERKRL